mmetsp:Transcript_2203/g.3552  ORF Transcript_2203/g.3552 Transcript_2203/m.3552 type:complete len:347 (+) Transcript_2203:53-1093(+)
MPASSNHARHEAQHRALVQRLNTPFDPANDSHVFELRRLWELAWPSRPWEGLKAELWTALGFQRSEPVSDLRGAGLTGVINLAHFVENRRACFDAIAASGPDHNLAVTGLAVTMLLRTYLGLHGPEQVIQPVVPGGDNARAPAAVRRRFVAWATAEAEALQLLHAIFVAALQRRWAEARGRGWNLLDFPVLLIGARDHIVRALPRAATPWCTEHLEACALKHELPLPDVPPHQRRGQPGKRRARSDSGRPGCWSCLHRPAAPPSPDRAPPRQRKFAHTTVEMDRPSAPPSMQLPPDKAQHVPPSAGAQSHSSQQLRSRPSQVGVCIQGSAPPPPPPPVELFVEVGG